MIEFECDEVVVVGVFVDENDLVIVGDEVVCDVVVMVEVLFVIGDWSRVFWILFCVYYVL